MPLLRSFSAVFVVTALLAACGGSDSPSDPGGNNNGGGGGGGDTRVIKSNPSFATDIQEIFTRIGCTGGGCHGDGTGAGMTLGTNVASNYGALVGVPSTTEPAFNRVTPNDATNSYIVIKLEGRQSVGARMPFRGPSLDNIDMTNIKNWINGGAMNN
jgi:hypothetical protein